MSALKDNLRMVREAIISLGCEPLGRELYQNNENHLIALVSQYQKIPERTNVLELHGDKLIWYTVKEYRRLTFLKSLALAFEMKDVLPVTSVSQMEHILIDYLQPLLNETSITLSGRSYEGPQFYLNRLLREYIPYKRFSYRFGATDQQAVTEEFVLKIFEDKLTKAGKPFDAPLSGETRESYLERLMKIDGDAMPANANIIYERIDALKGVFVAANFETPKVISKDPTVYVDAYENALSLCIIKALPSKITEFDRTGNRVERLNALLKAFVDYIMESRPGPLFNVRTEADKTEEHCIAIFTILFLNHGVSPFPLVENNETRINYIRRLTALAKELPVKLDQAFLDRQIIFGEKGDKEHVEKHNRKARRLILDDMFNKLDSEGALENLRKALFENFRLTFEGVNLEPVKEYHGPLTYFKAKIKIYEWFILFKFIDWFDIFSLIFVKTDKPQTCVIKDNVIFNSVNKPAHYAAGKIEVIDFIEDQKLDFCTANAIKYIARAGKKDVSKEAEDLQKAVWYLQRKIANLEKQKA